MRVDDAVPDTMLLPGDAFRVVSELVGVVSAIKEHLDKKPEISEWILQQEQRNALPNMEDLEGSARSLLRLQRTYLR